MSIAEGPGRRGSVQGGRGHGTEPFPATPGVSAQCVHRRVLQGGTTTPCSRLCTLSASGSSSSRQPVRAKRVESVRTRPLYRLNVLRASPDASDASCERRPCSFPDKPTAIGGWHSGTRLAVAQPPICTLTLFASLVHLARVRSAASPPISSASRCRSDAAKEDAIHLQEALRSRCSW